MTDTLTLVVVSPAVETRAGSDVAEFVLSDMHVGPSRPGSRCPLFGGGVKVHPAQAVTDCIVRLRIGEGVTLTLILLSGLTPFALWLLSKEQCRRSCG